jgi:hypothetical protein
MTFFLLIQAGFFPNMIGSYPEEHYVKPGSQTRKTFCCFKFLMVAVIVIYVSDGLGRQTISTLLDTAPTYFQKRSNRLLMLNPAF